MPKVSSYPSVSLPLAGTETLYGVQSGNSRKLTTGDISDLARSTSNIRLQTAIAAASQTSIDFTGVPAWANRVTITASGLSTNGTSPVIVQIGDSGGFETTGYTGAVSAWVNGGGLNAAALSSGFSMSYAGGDTAAAVLHHTVTLHRHSGNTWVAKADGALSNALFGSVMAGSKTLSDVLTQVRITTAGGTAVFDAVSVPAAWA